MDDIADALMGTKSPVPAGWIGSIVNPAINAANPLHDIGRWLSSMRTSMAFTSRISFKLGLCCLLAII